MLSSLYLKSHSIFGVIKLLFKIFVGCISVFVKLIRWHEIQCGQINSTSSDDSHESDVDVQNSKYEEAYNLQLLDKYTNIYTNFLNSIEPIHLVRVYRYDFMLHSKAAPPIEVFCRLFQKVEARSLTDRKFREILIIQLVHLAVKGVPLDPRAALVSGILPPPPGNPMNPRRCLISLREKLLLNRLMGR